MTEEQSDSLAPPHKDTNPEPEVPALFPKVLPLSIDSEDLSALNMHAKGLTKVSVTAYPLHHRAASLGILDGIITDPTVKTSLASVSPCTQARVPLGHIHKRGIANSCTSLILRRGATTSSKGAAPI